MIVRNVNKISGLVGYQGRMKFRRANISSSALTISRTLEPKEIPSKENISFGTSYSDHMLTIKWQKENGWNSPEIKPFENFSISPAASTLHYAMQCFEGMKAYKGIDGSIRMFRPNKNMQRLKKSMSVLNMPIDFLDDEFLNCIKELVRLDKHWIPDGEGYSLYLRPAAIATNPYLGLAPPDEILLFCITSPVGPYYKTNFEPVQLTAECDSVRAWPGGTGDAKVGGNYGPTIKPGFEASLRGYSQILWLFGKDHSITEVGTMNVFFVIYNDRTGKKEILTPPLTRGDIIAGITRLSILELAATWGDSFEVVERCITMPEVQNAAKEGRLLEAFGAGTAAVVVPISSIEYEGDEIQIPATGEVTQRAFNEISDIQYGKGHDPNGWSVIL